MSAFPAVLAKVLIVIGLIGCLIGIAMDVFGGKNAESELIFKTGNTEASIRVEDSDISSIISAIQEQIQDTNSTV